MIMWLFIFIGMFIGMILGIIYMIRRIYKTEIIGKITKNNKIKGIVLSTLIMLIITYLIYYFLGLINLAIVIIHALIIWLIIDLINFLIQKYGHKKISNNIVIIFIVIILGGYFTYAYNKANNVVATRYTFNTKKDVDNLKILQISDSHVGATFDGDGFLKEVLKMNKENADVVVITGDFVDDDTSYEDMVKSCKALSQLKSKYGVYFVFGNHDKGYYDNRGYGEKELVSELKKNNVIVLEDEVVTIANKYYLIGRQDKSEENRGKTRASMSKLTKSLDKDKYMIVLDHQPNDFKNQVNSNVDLVLSGHTHGGQFFPINYLGELLGENDMTYGQRKIKNTTFEVSSGISDWAIKFKTGCKSEYVVIDIKK